MSARYRLKRRLGKGGMAEVFEATSAGERGFQRKVAVKRMLPEVGRLHENMFLDEARIASHLHHANIVSVLDYGLAGQVPFQVLELVEGLDLQSALELGAEHGAPLPVEIALHVCTEVAHALDHAHQVRTPDGQPLGIVHRDVKPANILVSYDGDVKLGDFGIAFARDRLARTEVGIAKGTRAYMSPEQLIAGEVDGRSDLFALGCVLHALVDGDSPMTPGAAQELLEGEELKLSLELPADVAEIIERAVRRQKRDRYATAAELAAALGSAFTVRSPRPGKALTLEWMRLLRPHAEARRALEPLIDLPLESTPPLAQPPRRPRAPLMVALAALVATGLGAAAWFTRPPATTLAPTNAPTTAPTAAPTNAPPTTAPTNAPTNAPTVAQGSASGAAHGGASSAAPTGVPKAARGSGAGGAPAAGVAARPSVVRAAGKATAKHPAAAAPAASSVTPVVPSGSGHLLVGGEGALRAQIVIDGRPSGFAPKLLELPAGAHDVELVLANGSRVQKHLTLGESNTPSSPVRWLVP